MKKIVFLFMPALFVMACTTPEKEAVTEPEPEKSSVVLPYTASYSSQVNDHVSEADLLTVLNSYKAWETGDMAMLRSTLADTVSFNRWNGSASVEAADEIIKKWSASRDSLASVILDIAVYQKNHSIDKNADYVVLWYKEIDTYKDGRIDSADWHDINQVKDGKIVWYSQFKRGFK